MDVISFFEGSCREVYENNYEVLKRVCAEKSVIRHVSAHRLPDGTTDVEGNLKIWNSAIARFEQIQLWENGAPGYDESIPLQPQPSVIFVPAQNAEKPRGTVIVAHGGGFETRTGCEGMHTAKFFTDEGFNTAILTYRLKPYGRYDSMHDMQRAVRLLRARREELGITDKVACMGFSSGGMLSANCATHFDSGDPASGDTVERESCRPDAAVVCYGAFAFAALPEGGLADPFSDRTRNPFVASKEELIYFAPEVNVRPDSPPFFIWQTNSDDPRHSFALGQALTAVGVPFEMHLFPGGIHGLALADGLNDLSVSDPHIAQWAPLCAEWLTQRGI